MEIPALVVTALGVVLAIVRAVQVGRLSLNADAFVAVVERLLLGGNLDRARKLCSVVPETPLGAGGAALVANRDFPRGTTELVAADTLRAVFVDAFSVKASPLVRGRVLAVLSFAALVAPVAWAARSDALSVRLIGTSVGGLLVLAWSAYTSRRILSSGPVVLERLLPTITPLVLRGPATYRDADAEPPAAPSTTAGPAPKPRPPPPPDLGGLVFDVLKNGAREATQTFDQTIVKIGRDPRAHLRLDHPSVARMHAVVERGADAATIIDLGNAEGTLVNGEKISKAKLSHGDVITIGHYELVVGLGTPAAAVPEPPAPRASAAKPQPDPETDDPRTWPRDAVLYGFDLRSPDLFYEIATAIGRGSGLRFAKLRREGTPRFVVAMLGEGDVLADVRRRIEKETPGQLARFATPSSEIAPDAVYGPETRTYATLREEMARGEPTVLVTTRV